MADPVTSPAQRNLAEGLKRMRERQKKGHTVFQTAEFTRPQREALEHAGFLRRVIKGWYISAAPGERTGDTTAWNASFRDFIGRYCDERFGERWYLSPEISVLVHAGVAVLPRQVVVVAENAQRNVIDLLGGNSIFDRAPSEAIDERQLVQVGPLRLLNLPLALVQVPEVFFRTYPMDAQIALRQIRESGEILRVLLQGGHSFVAGRLAGAFRAINRPQFANDIVSAMTAVGYRITEADPFAQELPPLGGC